MAHPDEVVKATEEVPSKLIAEAQLRHEQADGDDGVTPQEKKQSAVEKAHALSTRPDGSYAQLHEVEEATLAVADEARVKEMKKEQADLEKADAALVSAATKSSGKDGGPVDSSASARK